MPTITGGFSTKNQKEMEAKLAQSGASVTLPFSGSATTTDQGVADMSFVNPDGGEIPVTKV